VIVVDSVVNHGNSVRRVLHRLEKSSLGKLVAVYVLSGVMQATAAEALPREFPRTRFLTLRVSSNQYSGRGGTDTGNRLFGT
jgi:uracil phosphoribosyltransferase